MLIDRNADVNVFDNKGQSPLYLACKLRHIDITKLLLSHNADLTLVDDKKRSSLHAVCNVFSIPLTEKEIQNLRDLITLLIEYRVDLSHPDNEGKTALHFACKAGCLAIVELLAVKKADFTVCYFNGQTPLDEAKIADHCDIVRFLECFEDETSEKGNFELAYHRSDCKSYASTSKQNLTRYKQELIVTVEKTDSVCKIKPAASILEYQPDLRGCLANISRPTEKPTGS
ncbi:unnamed protein product [Mytilus coruscus]|uniref:Uncharacterized protein n=1 Tax=Mytilus coruscus TaxID=42192 RepID=A0A6J8C457_MYTCO|nr:unnamed protein product [Mytilus coruscus]